MNEFDETSRALEEFSVGPALDAADAVGQAFELAGERIATSLEQAAKRGELSFNALASSVAQDLTRLLVSEVLVNPISDALTGALSGLGGNLLGGAVGGGGASTTVNLNVSGVNNSADLARSFGQIASAAARAVQSGQRYG